MSPFILCFKNTELVNNFVPNAVFILEVSLLKQSTSTKSPYSYGTKKKQMEKLDVSFSSQINSKPTRKKGQRIPNGKLYPKTIVIL